MIYTTLNRIRNHGPRPSGWKKLLAHLGKTAADDDPLAYAEILKSNGLDDALWCLRAEPQHSKKWLLFAGHCERSVQRLMTDRHSIVAIDVAERHANGLAWDAELDAELDAAWDAAWDAALDAAWDAALDAAWDAAWYAAWDAARDEMSADFLEMVSAGSQAEGGAA